MQNLNESLQAKYPHLELAILPLSQVNKDNESKRIDSEYFKKEYLEKINLLSKISTKLENLMTSGYYGILPKSDDYLENGLSLVRGKDIREFSLEISNLVKVPYDYFQERYQIHKNDILFLVKGYVDDADSVLFISEEPSEKMIFNGSVFKLQVKNINPAFLYVFMMTKYFTFQKVREVANNIINYNSLPTIKNFLIPQFSQDFQLEIQNLVQDSHKALEDSKRLYKEAQELLYKELELDFKNPLESLLKSSLQAKKASELANINDISKKYPHLNISVRPLSKSLHKSGRLDSEYYQSKYDLMETKIKDYKGGYCKLQNLVLNYSGGFAFSSDDYLENGDLALIRINNIKNADLDMSNAVYLKKQCEKLSPKDKVKQGDILISMSGSIGLSCLIKENIEAMTNQRILKISIKDFSGDVLVLLLNSIFCRLQFERIGTGGVQTNISSNDILNILIPKINPATQEQIALKIQKSFTLRAKSKDLLQNAKIKLENAIENGTK